jgi:hypothetical protein
LAVAAAAVYLTAMHALRKILVSVAAILGVATALWAVDTEAGERPVLVELYTSQGCSSCPPADASLARLARRDDVVALSLHVDYWDYLGWRDTFGQRQFAERQHGYREAWGKRVVYTPQMIVQGKRDVSGLRAGAIEDAVRGEQGAAPVVQIRIEPHDGMLMCVIEPVAGKVSGTIWIAKYNLASTVAIERGENAGRSITYHNVVTSLNRFGDWTGSDPDEYPMPMPDPGEGVAVWLQEGDSGPVLAVAKSEKPAN